LLVGSCGGSSVEGTYGCPDDTLLELRGDGTFTATVRGETFEGTYTQEGDTLVMTVAGVDTILVEIRDGELLLEGEEERCVKL